MKPSAVWCDGRFVTPETAVVAANDEGLLSGLGVFETLRAIDGAACFRARHLARLVRSATALGISPQLAMAERGLDAVLAVAPSAARVRLTVTAGGRVLITAGPLPEYGPAAVMVSPFVRNERGPLAGAKITSYADNAVAFRHAASLGFDEALLFNTRGHLAEGTRTNVFVEIGGRLLTPPLSSGCLPGVIRGALLEADLAAERELRAEHLAEATGMVLTSALRMIQPVARIGERLLQPPTVLLALTLPEGG